MGGTVAAGAGALFGMAKGASKVERENAAFAAKSKEKLMGKEAEMAAVQRDAAQMGFQTAMQQMQPQVQQALQQAHEQGKQEGEAKVLADLEQHAKAEHKPAHHDHAKHEHKHTAHEDKPKVSFAAAEADRRAATAAAGAAIGA